MRLFPCLLLTLQAVEDGKHVEQCQTGRPVCKKDEGPRQPQEDSETGRGSQVVEEAAAFPCRMVGLHLSDLNQDHDKHGDVAQQDEQDIGHHHDVEERVVVLEPAAGGDREGEGFIAESIKVSQEFIERLPIIGS